MNAQIHHTLAHPTAATFLGVSGHLIMWLIVIAALSLFFYTLYRRLSVLRAAQPDPRWDHMGKRLKDLVIYGLIQKRQPRYLWSGLIHLMIFWGFMVLGLRSLQLITQGLGFPIFAPLMSTGFGPVYDCLRDVFEIIVLFACVWAILRRAVLRPERYEGSPHKEAYLVLGLISLLMITDMVYEGTTLILEGGEGKWVPAAQLAAQGLSLVPSAALPPIHGWAYWLHILTFFFFLNYLPFGKHFHIITGLPTLFFRKRSKGTLKPARWGVEDLEELETLGVEKLKDFTWKHILDFYTCTQCGRCTDNCPAHAIGRPLNPKMLTMTLRHHVAQCNPLFGSAMKKSDSDEGVSLIGGIISEDVVWSCTTCGACEAECPLFIEYIDKIVDMRRHLIETAQGPKAFNQVLMHVEKTGNPFGKPPSKRADWIREGEHPGVRILKPGDEVDVLYFVDSYGAFDPVGQAIAGAIVKGLKTAGMDFGILGPLEKDSGHQVRRMGEEGLFQLLMEENLETFRQIRFKRIVTTDPHAFNTLKNDYPHAVEVLHYTQFFARLIGQRKLRPQKTLEDCRTYTYHDPCYLGRHNDVYIEPREILQSMPGMHWVEMEKSRDRSFCCGGGDIVLWHEIESEQMRMAEKRVQMARAAGADGLVTACPFCFIHFEDAIKTLGLENEMRVFDLMQLLASTLVENPAGSGEEE